MKRGGVPQPSAPPSFGLQIKPLVTPGPKAPTVPRKAPAATLSPLRSARAVPSSSRRPVAAVRTPQPPPAAAPLPAPPSPSVAQAAAVVIEEPQPPPAAAEPVPPAPPPAPPAPFSVVVRYNHYNSSFPVVNGALRAADIDDAYCFSHVFRGCFRMHLNTYVAPKRPAREVALELAAGLPAGPPEDTEGLPVGEATRDAGAEDSSSSSFRTTVFLGCQPGVVYRVWIEEDPAEVARRESAGLSSGPPSFSAVHSAGLSRAAAGAGVATTPGQRAVALLTAELRGLSPDELREGGARYRQLLEARDLEDTLYAAGGAVTPPGLGLE